MKKELRKKKVVLQKQKLIKIRGGIKGNGEIVDPPEGD